MNLFVHQILKLALIFTPAFSNQSILDENKIFLAPNNIYDFQSKDLESNKNQSLVIPIKTPIEIKVDPFATFYIKDRILKIRTLKEKTYLVGQKPGLTTIKSGKISKFVRILSNEEWLSYEEFLKIFSDHPSIFIDYSKFYPTIEGEILIDFDFIQILKWLEIYKPVIRFNLKFINPELEQTAKDLLSSKLGIKVDSFDESLNLKLAKLPDKNDLKNLANLNLNLQQDNSNGKELGLLDIQFISLTDAEIKNASPILPTSMQWTIGEKIKIVSQIINSDYSQLNTLNNKSSLINLMLFENEKTEYHSGGEFAIEQRSIYRNDVQWKTFGLFIEATPISRTKDEVYIDLKIRMSYVVASDMSQPSLSQDSWNQKFRIQKKKSLIVSNSLTNMLVKNRNDHLLLKSIPLLGALFKGKNANKEKSNVFMVIKLNGLSEGL